MKRWLPFTFIAVAGILVVPVYSQDPPARPEGAQPPAEGEAAAKPAASDYSLSVVELKGKVHYAPLGTDAKADEGWTAAKVGDRLTSGTQVRTGVRSKVKLSLTPSTPPSVFMIEPLALMCVDELFKGRDESTGQEAVVTRLGLAYGAIRAGVVEQGDVRSDVEIRSSVATLAKRGTWDFRFFMERGTGYFQISLADRGLVQAIQNQTGARVTLLPGQFVNQLMARWIETARFIRPVNFQDWYGLQGAELVFNLTNQTGLGVLSPGGNAVEVLNATGRQSSEALVGTLEPVVLSEAVTQQVIQQTVFDVTTFGPRRRAEGDFGIGQGIVPVFFDSNNPLVRLGGAKVGRMDFWKSDAVRFVKQHRKMGR